MVGFIVLIIISLLPFISTYLTSPQDIFIEDSGIKKRKEIFKKKASWKLTKKGKLYLVIAAFTILFAWIQYNENIKTAKSFRDELAMRDSINRTELRIRDYQSRRDLFVRDSINNDENRKRDSLSNDKVEKGKNETISSLAKYSLKYDSSQKLITRLIKDSAKKTIIQPIDPILRLCENGISKKKYDYDSLIITIRKCAAEAQCKNVNVDIYIIASTDSLLSLEKPNLLFAAKQKFIEPGGEMFAGEYRANNISFSTKATPRLFYVFAWVLGSYQNSDRTKTFNIDKMYFLDIKTNYMGIVSTPDIIKSFVIKNGFK